MRFIVLASVVVLAACAGDRNITVPEGSPRRTLSPTSVWVTGQTIGPDFSIWTPAGSQTLCGDDAIIIYYSNNAHSVHWTRYCQPSAFSGGPGGQTYDGGIVNLYVQSDNGDQHVGNVTGDMSQQGNAADAPEGAYVKLVAQANTNCSFASWDGVPEGMEGTNPVTLTGGSYDITATFTCR
ncbi:MAG TPA: hypothetical protein VJT67_17260 [Longimicrobiaceae bacterium]|nr:hypothetical protein [Longimicrobiaceae bacterium]